MKFPDHADETHRRRQEVFAELGIATKDEPAQPALVVDDTVLVDDIGPTIERLRGEVHEVARRIGATPAGPDLLLFGNAKGDRPARRMRVSVGFTLSETPSADVAPARAEVLPSGPTAIVDLPCAGRYEVGDERVDGTGVTADVHRWDRRSAELWEVLRIYVREAGGSAIGNWAGAGGWQTLPADPEAAATLHLPINGRGG
jgi:hypothetical protein